MSYKLYKNSNFRVLIADNRLTTSLLIDDAPLTFIFNGGRCKTQRRSDKKYEKKINCAAFVSLHLPAASPLPLSSVIACATTLSVSSPLTTVALLLPVPSSYLFPSLVALSATVFTSSLLQLRAAGSITGALRVMSRRLL